MMCSVCSNELTKITVWKPGGPMGKRIRTTETICQYCNWKGTTGPGKQLKEIIRRNRDAENTSH